MRPLFIIAITWLVIGFDHAAAQRRTFDAASIKHRTAPGGGYMGRRPGGQFVARGVSLQDLIVFATALQEQLGIKFESTRAPVDVLVITHAEFARAN